MVTSEWCADVSQSLLLCICQSPRGWGSGQGRSGWPGCSGAGALLPWGGIAIPAGTACRGLSHCHLLRLSTAQGPSLRQETIAFPSVSPTLGKPPRQPAEQISGASHAGTEPPPRRAVSCRAGEAGICCLASDLPMAGCQPSAVPGLSCQLCPRGCMPGELRGRGPGDAGREGGQPGSRAPRGWSGQRDGEAARGLSACRDGVHPSCRSHAR